MNLTHPNSTFSCHVSTVTAAAVPNAPAARMRPAASFSSHGSPRRRFVPLRSVVHQLLEEQVVELNAEVERNMLGTEDPPTLFGPWGPAHLKSKLHEGCQHRIFSEDQVRTSSYLPTTGRRYI